MPHNIPAIKQCIFFSLWLVEPMLWMFRWRALQASPLLHHVLCLLPHTQGMSDNSPGASISLGKRIEYSDWGVCSIHKKPCQKAWTYDWLTASLERMSTGPKAPLPHPGPRVEASLGSGLQSMFLPEVLLAHLLSQPGLGLALWSHPIREEVWILGHFPKESPLLCKCKCAGNIVQHHLSSNCL